MRKEQAVHPLLDARPVGLHKGPGGVVLLGGHDFFGLGFFGFFDLFAFELQVLFVLDVDLDEVLALEFAGEHRLGERVLDVVLDRPTQRPRSVGAHG